MFFLHFRRLIDKAQRVEVIAASFKSDGADASHIAEIEEMITPTEQEQLKNHKTRMAKYVNINIM